MRVESKNLRKALATVFESINEKNLKSGINAQYEYKLEYVDLGKESEHDKAMEISLIMKEMGYPDVTLQKFGYIKPNSLDKFNFEYNVILSLLTSLTETSLITYLELGKSLNKDKKFQKEAINSLRDDKEINSDTDK